MANATVTGVTNGDMESPVLGSGVASGTVPTGWFEAGGAATGAGHGDEDHAAIPTDPDGAQWLFMNDGVTVWQLIGTVSQNEMVSVSFDLSAVVSDSAAATTFNVILAGGGTGSSDWTVLDLVDETSLTLPTSDNDLQANSVTLDTGVSVTDGQPLWLGFSIDASNAFSRLQLDDVTATGPSSTPEPGTIVIAMLALAGLGLTRRRRARA